MTAPKSRKPPKLAPKIENGHCKTETLTRCLALLDPLDATAERERESEREKYGRIPQGYLLSSKLRLSIQAGNGLETVGLWLGRWSSRAAGHLGLRE